MRAQDVMTTKVVTASPDTSVSDLANLLLRHRISAVPVVDGEQRILGMVSEGDLLSAHVQGQSIADPDSGVAIRLTGPTVATLRVTSVATDFAVTELVTGDVASLSGDVVLKLEAATDDAPVVPGKPATPGSSDAPIQW